MQKLMAQLFQHCRVDVESDDTVCKFETTDVSETFSVQSPVSSRSANDPLSVTIDKKGCDPTEINMVDLVRRISNLEHMVQQQANFNLLQIDKIIYLEKKVTSLEGQLIIVNSQFSVRDHLIEGLKGEIQRLQQ